MARENNSFIEYNTVSIEDSNDDDVTSLDEFEDAVEYMDDAYLIKTLTGKNTETNSTNPQHHTDTLSSAEDLEKLDEIGDITNKIAGTSMTAKENEASNSLQEDYTAMTAKERETSKYLPSEDIKADQVVESSDDTNTIAETSFITKANRISNNSQVEDIDVSSSIDELEITDEPTCTAECNVIVVAIDFGTTYSGWAFSIRKQFQDNKLDIQANSGWKSGDGLVTPKVPTCILFDKNEMFHSFGYEAESTYAELLDDNKSEDWRYFSKFKMSLFCDEHVSIMLSMNI